jgi:hypothetical protein
MNQFLVVDGVIAAQAKNVATYFNNIIYNFDTIIEIGFHRGGFSSYLNKNKRPNTLLFCYDITDSAKEIKDNSINFIIGDCFSQSIIEDIKNKIVTGNRTLVLCDGGNKEEEFILYSKFLKSKDVIMLHDYAHSENDYAIIKQNLNWPTNFESFYGNIKQSVEKNNLDFFMYEDFKSVLWGSFIKK